MLKQLIARLPLGSMIRQMIWRRKVGIALYHEISPECLEQQLQVLGRKYRFIPLDQLVDAIETEDWSGIPDQAMVITFDDGCRSFYQLKGILKRHQVPAIHYVPSGIVGTNRHFWFTEAGSEETVERLKSQPQSDQLAFLARQNGFAADREYACRQAMTIGEIQEVMAEKVDIGSHTVFHPILPNCNDGVAEEEIAGSKKQLEAALGIPIHHFSYPNGDFSARDEELVRRAGYRSARTVERGLNGPGTDPFRLRIVDVMEDRSADDMELIELRLLWYALKGLIKGWLS